MKKLYWTKFWKEYGSESSGKDPQTQVLRTLNKQPIDAERWARTLRFIENALQLNAGDSTLDLACGNGLITRMLAERCRSVTAVDISSDLLAEIDASWHLKIRKLQMDIRDCAFPAASFDKIVLYAGLQYLNDQEALILWEKAYSWLRPGGIFFLGDVPDRGLMWEFFNTEEREHIYFTRMKAGEPIVGNWYNRDFLFKLARYVGFAKVRVIPQERYMIYSKFRFDLLAKKD